MDKILEDCDCLGWGLGSLCSPTFFLGGGPNLGEDNRASVVTSNWLPTGAQAAMSSTQASILEPNLGGVLGEMLLVVFGPAKMHVRSKRGDSYYPVIYMRIIISLSHCNDFYAPISKDQCHKGFERCSLEVLVDSP